MPFSNSRKIFIGFLVLLFMCAVIFMAVTSKGQKLYSRAVLGLAEEMVMQDMNVSPPEVARTYAYITTMYYNVLAHEGKPGPAVVASMRMLHQIYPENDKEIENFLTKLNLDDSVHFSADTQNLIDTLLSKEESEREQKMVRNPRLTGTQYWSGDNPVGFGAQYWNQWVLKKSYVSSVPPPPAEGGLKQKESLEEVASATYMRTPEESAEVNFWSGMHMSSGLAGAWQDELFQVVGNSRITDKTYALDQMLLAQSIADAYIQVWGVKYTFWTKRPSAYGRTLNMSMEDPSYPSYVSEYSAIGAVASNVLTALFPAKKDIWREDLRAVSQVGVLAGCAFTYDEDEGLRLGNVLSDDILANPAFSSN